MAVDDVIVRAGPVAVPLDYKVPNGTEIIPRSVSCKLNGGSAGGAYVPVLEVIAPSGAVTAYCARRVEIAAGASVFVSWFPGVAEADDDGSSSTGGGTISSLVSPLGSLAIQNAGGPAASVDVAASGVTPGSYGDSLTVPQVTVDDFGRLTGVANVAIASGAGGGIVQVSKIVLTSGDLTTSSTVFVDATGLTTTITTGAHRCLVLFTAAVQAASASAANVAVDVAIDGTRQGQTYGLTIVQAPSVGANMNGNISFVYLTSPLTAAAHTIKIQWRVDGGTGKMYASAGVTPAILTVLELGV